MQEDTKSIHKSSIGHNAHNHKRKLIAQEDVQITNISKKKSRNLPFTIASNTYLGIILNNKVKDLYNGKETLRH